MLAFEVGIVNDRYLRFWFTFFFIARDASKHKLINLHTGILKYPSSRVPYQFSWLWGRGLELLLLLRGQIFTLAGTRILFSHTTLIGTRASMLIGRLCLPTVCL